MLESADKRNSGGLFDRRERSGVMLNESKQVGHPGRANMQISDILYSNEALTMCNQSTLYMLLLLFHVILQCDNIKLKQYGQKKGGKKDDILNKHGGTSVAVVLPAEHSDTSNKGSNLHKATAGLLSNVLLLTYMYILIYNILL